MHVEKDRCLSSKSKLKKKEKFYSAKQIDSMSRKRDKW